MIWILGGLVLFALLAFVALQIAIARNGPAVLDTVDRITAADARVERLATVRFGDHPAQKLVVHRPQGLVAHAAQPVLVFIHGGSWDSGDPEDYGFVGRSFAEFGFVTVKAGYRLGADGAFPAMLEDGAAALAWVRENIAELGGDPDHIVLMGHSAGAYNAAMLALDGQWLAARNVPIETVKGVVGLSGPYDFYPFDSDFTRAAFGHSDQPELTQPVNFPSAESPPFLLIHGEQDNSVRVRNSLALKQRLAEAGANARLHVFAQMDHSAPLLQLASPWRRDPAVRDLIRQFIADPETSVPVQAQTR